MAKDVRAGRAFIEMFLKGDKMERQLRTMQRRLKRFNANVGAIAKTFASIGVAAGTTAAVGILKAAKAAGDLNEAASKFETVFGDRANVVQKWAFEVGEALGVTRREMLDTLSGFQDLFVPIGITADKAEEMSIALTQLAIDLASFNNMRTEDVVRDLQAAMTGSSETMKKYGVIVDAAAVKQELLARGIGDTATNADKLQARLELIMRSTTAAQGDAARTSGEFANMVKNLRADFTDMMADIGQEFLPTLSKLAEVGTRAISDIREAIKDFDFEIGEANNAVLDLARTGNWEEAGELIGLQLKQGVRKAIGPGIFDFLEDAEGFIRRQGIPTTLGGSLAQGRRDLQMAAEGLQRPDMSPANQRLGRFFAGASQTSVTDARIEELIALTKKIQEDTRRNREANETQEGGVFQ